MAREPNKPPSEEKGATSNYVLVRCVFCKGRGRDPRFRLASKCVACGGRGKVLIGEPYETCPACDGEGRQPGTDLHCLPCRGRGLIPERTSAERN